MRVTADKKIETREKIVRSAARLFRAQGFHGTSTRDIAAAAQIATGTLFNYFPTKEALAMSLAAEAFEIAEAEFDRRRNQGESLEELVFTYIITGLRQLEPERAYIGGVLHSVWSGFLSAASMEEAAQLREHHLETIGSLILERLAPGMTFDFHIQMHLYWTLYLGVLAFWARDESPHQERTLAMLDHVVRMFLKSLPRGNSENEVKFATEI